MSSRRALLAMVHIARKQLALDEDTYRLVLEQTTGKSSAADLSDQDLGKVIDHFRAKGWAPKPKGRSAPRPRPSKNAHVRKVWAIWSDMCKAGVVRNPTRAALRAYVERMTGVTDPEWLSPGQATVVVEGLKAWRERESKS